MASEFQEISHLSPQISLATIAPAESSSFLVKLDDANSQIQFIFAVKSNNQRNDSDSAADDGDDDGFRTPTTSDHKIPAVKQCPPAPRRPKPISCSRRRSPRVASSSGGVRRGFRVYVSDEIVESIFSSSFGSDLSQQKMKNKKARRDDRGDE